jgi:hypothetical protein
LRLGHTSLAPFLPPTRHETAWALSLFVAGLLPRTIQALNFPTIPVSDFRTIVESASLIAGGGASRGAWEWRVLGPALPLLLSALFRLVPASPELVARFATALATGLAPLLPYSLWRGALSLRARVLAGFFLALWPGQILFSGVVALDNWAMLPTVALGALAVRAAALRNPARPGVVALLYTAASAVRPEMALVLIPLALVGLRGPTTGALKRNLAIAAISSMFLVVAISAVVALTTGTFRITPSHAGGTILGAYVPGAGLDYWADPKPFVAAVEPALLEQDQSALNRGELRIAWAEFWRRPQFHAIRILAGTLNGLLRNDAGLLYWSMTGPGVLPEEAQIPAERLLDHLQPLLWLAPQVGAALFIFSLAIIAAYRSRVARLATPLLAAIGIKLAVHGIAVAQPRYYIPAIALGMLLIAICLDILLSRGLGKVATLSAAAALFGLLGLNVALTTAERYVQRHDEIAQMVYRFPLRTGAVQFQCVMNRGRLLSLYQSQFTVALSADQLSHAPSAVVLCTTPAPHEPLTLLVDASTALSRQSAGAYPTIAVVVNGARVLGSAPTSESTEEWRAATRASYPENTAVAVEMRMDWYPSSAVSIPSPTTTFRLRSR